MSIDAKALRTYVLASGIVRVLETVIATQFGSVRGELSEFNVVSLVRIMSDLNIDSVLELDALVRSHDEMIVMVSKLERSDFKTKVPVGFSLLILSYILAAEKFKEERTLATWLDEHFTGHPVDQCSFARGILCATMVKGNDDGPQHRTDFGKRTGTQGD